MKTQPAARAVTTMASPMIISKDEPFLTKLVFVVVALAIGLVCFVALMALLSAVMPRTAERCRAVVARWPFQAFLAGLLTYAVGGSLAVFFLSRGYIPRLLGVQIVPGMLATGLALVVALLLLTSVGATGTVRLIGERLTASPGQSVTPVRQVALGTLAAVLGGWFPLVGWVVVTPGLLLVSCGALLVGAIRRVGPETRDEVPPASGDRRVTGRAGR